MKGCASFHRQLSVESHSGKELFALFLLSSERKSFWLLRVKPNVPARVQSREKEQEKTDGVSILWVSHPFCNLHVPLTSWAPKDRDFYNAVWGSFFFVLPKKKKKKSSRFKACGDVFTYGNVHAALLLHICLTCLTMDGCSYLDIANDE